MPVIGTIREHSKVLAWVFGISLSAFLGEEIIQYVINRNHSSQQTDIAGKVGDKKISLFEYQEAVNNAKQYFQIEYKFPIPDYFLQMYETQIWNRLVNDIAYKNIAKELHIGIGDDELVDMVQGDHIYPELQQHFIDPKTKQFSKSKLLDRLADIANDPIQREQWENYENYIIKGGIRDKINTLFEKTSYMNSLEIQRKWYIEKTKFNLQYIFIFYDDIKVDDSAITDDQLQQYIKDHSYDYQTDEVNEIDYTLLEVKQSEDDINTETAELESLKHDLALSESPLSFAQMNTDNDDNDGKELIKDIDKNPLLKDLKINDVAIDTTGKVNKIYRYMGVENDEHVYYVIEKDKLISDATMNKFKTTIKNTLSVVKNQEEFKTYCQTYEGEVKHCALKENDKYIDGIADTKKIIRTIFEEKTKTIGPVSVGNKFIICFKTKHIDKGLEPIDNIKERVNAKLLKYMKYQSIVGTKPTIDQLKGIYEKAKYGECKEIQYNTKDITKGVKVNDLERLLFIKTDQAPCVLQCDDGVLVCTISNIVEKEPSGEDYDNFAKDMRKKYVEDQMSHIQSVINKTQKVIDMRN